MSGTTSACAENTERPADTFKKKWNYLRTRGEYAHKLPPRARRIPVQGVLEVINVGTTSACAENTRHECGPRRLLRNYLRVRGEYIVVVVGAGGG